MSHQNYWGVSGNDRTIQLGYNDGFKRISYGVYLRDTRGQYGYSDRSVNFTMSIPLDWGQNNNSTTANSQRGAQQAERRQLLDRYQRHHAGRPSHELLGLHRAYAVLRSEQQPEPGYSSSIGNIDGSYASIARNTASKGWASVACWCTPAARP